MLSSLANYLFGGNVSQNSRKNDSASSRATRFRQVEVENEWVLIDQNVEGTAALEESWYVTPPACFTQAEPVNVETSPLENLLIEHPSMSVYHETSCRHDHVAPSTPPPTPDAPKNNDDFLDLLQSRDLGSYMCNTLRSYYFDARRNPIPQERSRASNGVRTGNHLHSAQKIVEKRSTQNLKRSYLERSNKLRYVLSVKGKRPRRQDRLRLQNSGANNNRKC